MKKSSDFLALYPRDANESDTLIRQDCEQSQGLMRSDLGVRLGGIYEDYCAGNRARG